MWRIAAVHADSSLDVAGVDERRRHKRQKEEAEAEVDSDECVGSVSKNDDQSEDEEHEEHVYDGEDAGGGDVGVQVGEVVNGGDEGIPGDEGADAQYHVCDVGQVERVLGDLSSVAE